MSLELHRQRVFPALAVVGGVDGINVPPPARKLGGVIPADTVELHGMDAAQGYYQYIAGHTAGLELNGLPTLPIDYE